MSIIQNQSADRGGREEPAAAVRMAVAGAVVEVEVEMAEAGFVVNDTDSGARSHSPGTNLRESNIPITVPSTQGSNNNTLDTSVFRFSQLAIKGADPTM